MSERREAGKEGYRKGGSRKVGMQMGLHHEIKNANKSCDTVTSSKTKSPKLPDKLTEFVKMKNFCILPLEVRGTRQKQV